MEKKEYKTPELEIKEFEVEDVIAPSAGVPGGHGGNDPV